MIHAEGEQSQLQALYCNHCKAMNIKPNTRVHAEVRWGPWDGACLDWAQSPPGPQAWTAGCVPLVAPASLNNSYAL